MTRDLEPACGLPVTLNQAHELDLGADLNQPSYTVRRLHDLDAVWANPVRGEDRVIYRYTSALHRSADASIWADANICNGIVVFTPGVFGGDLVKSSGQRRRDHPTTEWKTSSWYRFRLVRRSWFRPITVICRSTRPPSRWSSRMRCETA